jgi:hypothetical protein
VTSHYEPEPESLPGDVVVRGERLSLRVLGALVEYVGKQARIFRLGATWHGTLPHAGVCVHGATLAEVVEQLNAWEPLSVRATAWVLRGLQWLREVVS